MSDQVKAPDRIFIDPAQPRLHWVDYKFDGAVPYVPESRLAEVRKEVWDDVINIANNFLDNSAHFGYGLRDRLLEAARSKSSPAVKEAE